MKATRPPLKLFLMLGLICFAAVAQAATYELNCVPAGEGPQAAFKTTVRIERDAVTQTLSGDAVLNLALHNTDGSPTVSESNMAVHGQVDDAQTKNHHGSYKVLFGEPVTAPNLVSVVSYARIAVGDPDQSTGPNSYIRDIKGVYYYAHCQSN